MAPKNNQLIREVSSIAEAVPKEWADVRVYTKPLWVVYLNRLARLGEADDYIQSAYTNCAVKIIPTGWDERQFKELKEVESVWLIYKQS